MWIGFRLSNDHDRKTWISSSVVNGARIPGPAHYFLLLRPFSSWLNFFLVPFRFNCCHTLPSLCGSTILGDLVILQLSPPGHLFTFFILPTTLRLVQRHVVHCELPCNWRFAQIAATFWKNSYPCHVHSSYSRFFIQFRYNLKVWQNTQIRWTHLGPFQARSACLPSFSIENSKSRNMRVRGEAKCHRGDVPWRVCPDDGWATVSHSRGKATYLCGQERKGVGPCLCEEYRIGKT